MGIIHKTENLSLTPEQEKLLRKESEAGVALACNIQQLERVLADIFNEPGTKGPIVEKQVFLRGGEEAIEHVIQNIFASNKEGISVELIPARRNDAHRNGFERRLERSKKVVDRLSDIKTFLSATRVVGGAGVINLAVDLGEKYLSKGLGAVLNTGSLVVDGALILIGVGGLVANIYNNRDEIKRIMKGYALGEGEKVISVTVKEAGKVRSLIIKEEEEIKKAYSALQKVMHIVRVALTIKDNPS